MYGGQDINSRTAATKSTPHNMALVLSLDGPMLLLRGVDTQGFLLIVTHVVFFSLFLLQR